LRGSEATKQSSLQRPKIYKPVNKQQTAPEKGQPFFFALITPANDNKAL
jgi:hypothetical protein